MLKPWIVKGQCWGEHHMVDEHTGFFFGNSKLKIQDLKTLFPEVPFCWLRQIHSQRVVQADPQIAEAPEADGLWASLEQVGPSGLGLAVVTADCLPILLSGPSGVAAVHAGWRGLAQGVLDSACRLQRFDTACIGPHIQAQDFEVHTDILTELLGGRWENSPHLLEHPERGKKKVNLASLAVEALSAQGVTQIHTSSISTFQDLDYSSYRRQQRSGLRNLSFALLRAPHR